MGRISVISAAGLAAAALITGCTNSGTGTGVEARNAVMPEVVSVSPTPGSRNVNGADKITVTYSQPLSAGAAAPRLTPAIAGTWQRSGNKAIFTPRAGFPAKTHVTVSIPAPGAAAGNKVRTTSATRILTAFTTGSYSTLRLQQLLAQLGYLPMTWSPSAKSKPVTRNSARQQLSAAYDPPAGSFRWKGGYPSLSAFWSAGHGEHADPGGGHRL